MFDKVLDDIKKIDRTEVAHFLNTTPSATTKEFSLIGIGITSFGQAMNPQVNTEKWIIHRSATSEVDSYQVQGDISQRMYHGDPCFEFCNDLRRKRATGSDAQTEILDIDLYDYTESSGVKTYKAELSRCTVAVTQYMNDDAVIESNIHYNGDPILGTVVITDGAPVFTPNA